MKVLVTGGSGFLGKRLKVYQPTWEYVSSKKYDLTSPEETRKMFEDNFSSDQEPKRFESTIQYTAVFSKRMPSDISEILQNSEIYKRM